MNNTLMFTAEAEIKNKTMKSYLLIDRAGSQRNQLNKLFPIFLKLENLNTLIIGGGSVGLEKLSAVLRNSPEASVTVVAPSIREEIFLLAEQYPNVRFIKRDFRVEDFE